jgi:O-antigen/teichoic acid export membrane protein
MNIRFRPIFKDVFLTFVTQAIVLVTFFFIYRLLAKNFGPEGVGEYSLVRRVVGFLQPILLLGLGVGIPRYVAMSKDTEQRSGYIKTGAVAVIVFALIFLTLINLFRDYFAKMFFGSSDYTNLVFPTSFFLAGLIWHGLVYSYLRGRLFIKTFNSLQIINSAIVPIIILIFFDNISIGKVITLIGINTLVIAFLFSLFFIKEFFGPIKKGQFLKPFKELLQYSLPRVPAIFAWQGLLSIGPIFAAHVTSIQEVGYFSVSQSLLYSIGAGIAPLGLILLPKVSALIVDERQEVIKENLNFLLGAILQCSVFICFQLIIFTDVIVEYWLGPEFSGVISTMRIVFLAISFCVLFVAMRNILDAAKTKPINTINLFISLGVFLIIGGILLFLIKFFSPIISLSIALTSAISCLGILTYNSIRKIYPEKLKKDLNYLWIAILINVLLGGIAIFAKSFVASRLYYLVLFEVLAGTIYLSILWFLRMEWLREIPKRIFS